VSADSNDATSSGDEAAAGSGSLRLRGASRDDVALILTLIRELADYEKLAHEVVATEEQLAESLFGERPGAEVLIAEWQPAEGVAEVAAFALFFHNFSTFLGRRGLYLEDLFVRPAYRGHGVGRALLAELARIAIARGCGRMEWWVLDWNAPAIEFYRRLGARPMDEWTVFRLTGDSLRALTS
jgi:GNAT superfamily N-acetyltransferase